MKRRGFTLIELLVVIAIIAILIALLVPAVQKVREAAARTQCINNLKQIGLAVQAFHDVTKIFPPGQAGNAGDSDQGFGWGTYILPYIDQGPLYDQLSREYARFIDPTAQQNPNPTRIRATPSYTAKVKPLLNTALNVFLCPTDNMTPVFHPVSGHSRSNYMGCHGNSNDGGTANGNGIFRRRRGTVKIAHVTDGTSNTICVGECRGWDPVNGFRDSSFPNSQWFGENQRYFPTWVGGVAENGLDDWDSYLKIGGDGSINLGGAGQGPRPINDISAQLTDLRGQCFGSNHGGGGANFVFADGTVRFVPQNINLAAYNSLCNRNDNKAVTLPD